MPDISVAASEVRVGDLIYSSTHYDRRNPFNRVVSVRREGQYVVIDVGVYYTLKHPMEGVSVRRISDTETKETNPCNC